MDSLYAYHDLLLLSLYGNAEKVLGFYRFSIHTPNYYISVVHIGESNRRRLPVLVSLIALSGGPLFALAGDMSAALDVIGLVREVNDQSLLFRSRFLQFWSNYVT